MEKDLIHVYYCGHCKEGISAMGLLTSCVYCQAKSPVFKLVNVLDQEDGMPKAVAGVPRGESRVKRNRPWWKRLFS